ncbi:hypothetical protein [Mycobacteroides abscessus]|uniref:hypothetical protein n=1 Tax=Mycobacteroides abscessus TaxID=36809 RepID=UPI0019D0F4BA|nr:hypothetical protein [Mycobacteroides abscessus]MBN7480756.1 hypothetical protein [Mycobacteroides abscessus subsp. massiliense]
MSIQPDIQKPANDPYGLVGAHWVIESENAYRMAEEVASDAATSATRHAQSAADAESKMVDEKGKTAQSVSGGYSSSAGNLREQAVNYNTISAWMSDASGKVLGAKKHIISLVMAGTQEIRDALNSELTGTPVTPSSTALIDKYRNDIAAVATKLIIDLDAIGHSLAGDPGASTTPTYVRAAASSTAPTVEQAAVHRGITGEGPHAEPHQLPEMPRAASTSSGTESTSVSGTPSAPTTPTRAVNPTLSNLVAGSTSPSGTPSSPSISSTKSPSTPSETPAGQGAQAHQPSEHRQPTKSAGLPNIPSIGLANIPAAAADIATAVSSATAHQLPTTTAPSTPGSSLPASTGITPGTSGPAPMPPAGLAPIGGLPTPPPVTQAAPVAQGTPPTPAPGVQAPSAPQQSPPAAPRGPVADLAWIQKSYGLSPSLDLPKPETTVIPALFISELPEPEAHLHRALATLRRQFEQAGWSQPLAVATIRRGLEARTVYATADAISIHPNGILLPSEALPLDEMPGTPIAPELLGSVMVSEKLTSLIPRGWEVEGLLSTVPAEESSQSVEQFQELVESGELLECKVSRGRDDVGADEALSLFARAAIGSGGVGELDAEAARIRAARWIGVQPAGYLGTLSRWYLSDAAEAMSRGNWSDAVYSSEKYMNVNQARIQAA